MEKTVADISSRWSTLGSTPWLSYPSQADFSPLKKVASRTGWAAISGVGGVRLMASRLRGHSTAQLNREFTHVTSPIYGLMGVFLCTEEVERNIILIAQDPAIVPRWDVKQIAGSHFDN